ncbi:MAG: protein kinase, partial [Myxococcus sp.]|nr:protein kinase [Myxococcus sp.]
MAGATACARCQKPVEPVDPMIGRVIGGFKILSVIGAGGMGKVYRAEQTKLQRVACIKTLLPELANDPDVAVRFEREGVATALMKHPNIVGIYDFGRTDDNILYIAMEFVDGRPLRSILRTEAPVPARRAIGLVDQILSALDEAHANGVVHRDLKPANVLVSRNRDGSELVKVVDFGIAKLVGSHKSEEELSLTRTGTMVGSLGYMAPEQILGEEVTAQADLYATGVVLWELLCGRRLFPGKSDLELAQKHLTQAPPSPSSVASLPLPNYLDEVVLKALEKSPERRFRTAKEFKEALERVTANEWASATPNSSSSLRALANPDTRSKERFSDSSLSGLKGLVPDHLLAHAEALPRHVVATEKRLLTIAFGELAGQAAVSEQISAATLKGHVTALAETFSGIVSRAEGLFERLPGAGFVMVFGLLTPHEDDPQRAVSCCFELLGAVEQLNRRLPRPLEFRLGVHAATVTSAYDETSLSESLGVAETVAVARRMLSTVPSGALIGSKPLEKLVRGTVQSTERAVVIGGQQQESVYELLSRSERAASRQPLVGRAAELGLLKQLLDAVRARKSGGVLVVGAPGLGKSRLLAEAVSQAQGAGAVTLTARGGRSFGAVPFEVAGQLVQSLLTRGQEGKGPAPWAGLGALGVPAADVARLERLFATSGKAAEASGAPPEDEVARDRAALLQVFDRAASRGPLLLVVDDFHLADEMTRQLIDELQRRAARHPFGLIASARPGDLAALAPRLRRVELAPFDAAATRAMLAALLQVAAPSQALVDFIHARADGSPFFIEELVKSMLETDAIQKVANEWTLRPDAASAVPDSLAMVVSARIERLDAPGRAMLRVGAVIGRSFSTALAAAAAPEPLDPKKAAEECVRRGLLATTDQPEVLRFEQSLVHEVMLQRLTTIDRKFLHQRIAEAMEKGTGTGEMPFEEMSKHFLAAEQPRKAIRYLRLAADRHLERGAFTSAIDTYKQCLELTRRELSRGGPLTEPGAVQLLDLGGRAMSAMLMAAPEQALALHDQLVQVVPGALGGTARAEPLRQKGLALAKLSRLPEAQATFKEAIALLGAGEAETVMAHLKSDLATVLENRGDLGGATAMLLDGLKLVSTQRVKDPHLLWQYLNGLGRLHLRSGKVQPAEEFFETARQRAKQAASGVGESKAVANLAVARFQRGDTASALALFGEALQLAEKAGDRLGVLRVLYNRARVQLKTNPAQAQADLETVL